MPQFASPFLARPVEPQEPQHLQPGGSWRAAEHVWDVKELDALALAQASNRPLLVRGEPGTGKSQLARAAAALLGWAFRYEVITARHEAQDLLWHYDAVERLASSRAADSVPMQDYVTPGTLWWALNPTGAATQQHKAHTARSTPGNQVAKADVPPMPGTVVLMDEIDKADSDLPNSLLEVLGNGSFTLPWGAPLLAPDQQASPTLIVITSNEERELPAAFVRRCICLHLVPPADAEESRFLDWLTVRAQAHFPEMAGAVLTDAARQVYQDRMQSPPSLGTRPGLAEYLDLLRALNNIAPGDAALQKAWLVRLAPYALLKQYPQDQSRGIQHPDPRLA